MKLRSTILLALVAVLYFLVNFQRTVVPGVLFNELQQTTGASASGIATIGSSFMLPYAFCMLLVGLFVDRLGGFRAVCVGGGLFALGSLAFPFAGRLWLMCLCRVLEGIGASCIYLSAVKEFSRLYPKAFSALMGLFICVGYFGGITAGSPFMALAGRIPWRSALAWSGALTAGCYVLFAVLLVFSLRKEQPVGVATHWSIRPIWEVLKSVKNRRLAYFSCVNWGLYYALLTVVGKKFLGDYSGMGAAAATGVVTAMGALFSGLSLCTGTLSSALGNRRRPFLLGAAGLATAAFALLVLALYFGVRSPILLTALFLCVTASAGTSPVHVAVMHEINPPERTGATVATLNFISFLLVGVLGNLCAAMMDLASPLTNAAGERIYGVGSYLPFFVLATLLSAFGYWKVRKLQIR